jgi:phosphoribosylformimino-5-aminoimidazole carboxamide ribotide isomerase
MSIRVIPVLDLKGGRAVHAVGGHRDHYPPLRTCLHGDSDVLGVARGFRDILHRNELYLADLDAIAGQAPGRSLHAAIRSLGFDLWLDPGVRDRTSLALLGIEDVRSLVIGLETIRGPGALAGLLGELTSDRLVFSLDLRDGHPMIAVDGAGWGTTDPSSIARSAVAIGMRRVLLLDLGRVGTGRGTGVLPLLGRLRQDLPDVEITVGGGVADLEDVRTLERAGADAVLIGSALHDGRIGARELAELSAQP